MIWEALDVILEPLEVMLEALDFILDALGGILGMTLVLDWVGDPRLGCIAFRFEREYCLLGCRDRKVDLSLWGFTSNLTVNLTTD